MEPVLARIYGEQTGQPVRRVNAILQHPEHRFMLANLDREVRSPAGRGILEIKTASYHSAPQWEDGIPVAYQCQVLHQMAVTGHDWADVAVLIGGQDFRIYRVERDEDKLRDLVQREALFWQKVERDIQPEPDGSTDAATSLQWLFPRDEGTLLDLSESLESNRLFAALLAERQRREESEQKEAVLCQQLQVVLGTASGAVFESGRVTWKRTKDRSSLDLERLTQDYPELVKAYQRTSDGSRRFKVYSGRSSS